MNITFTKSYNTDLYSTDLSPSLLKTYLVLCSYDYDNDCEVHPSQETLAKVSGISVRQIRRNLKALQEKGYIKIRTILNYAYQKSKNVYFLIKKYSNLVAETFKKTSENLSTDTGHNCHENTGHSYPPDYITFDKLDDDKEVVEIIESINEKEEVVKEAIDKMKDRNVTRKGFRNYLLKTIASVKAELNVRKASQNSTYNKSNYKKSDPKTSTFNNYKQTDYEKSFPGGYDGLEAKLLAVSDAKLYNGGKLV